MTTVLKVRKQFLLESDKIESVRKILEAKTATEAVNRSMDIVIANSRIKQTLLAIKGKGKIEDIYARSSR